MGGGPATAALVRETRARFGVPVVVRYTCTEAGVGVGTAPDDPPEDAEESVGRARRGVELTIRSDDDRPSPSASRSGLPALRRRHAGYPHDPVAHRRGVHRRRRGAHRRPRLRRRPGPAAPVGAVQGDVRPRRLQRLPPRGREGPGRPSRRGPRGVVARPDPVMGEIGVAVVVPPPAPRRPPSTRCGTTPGGGWPPTNCPRPSSSPTNCPVRPWRRSTGPHSAPWWRRLPRAMSGRPGDERSPRR